MTGLTPDVIRAWEKRYAVVSPIRGARGARLYTSADIGHLRLLARVVEAGRAIGDVARLKPAELERLAVRTAPHVGASVTGREPAPEHDGVVADILARIERFDYSAVMILLGDAVVGLGARKFVHEVALPLVRDVGGRWSDGGLSIAQEHLLSGMLRNLLGGLIQSRRATGRPILLATPAGERHEIGLLMVAVLALDTGVNVVYLGVDLPSEEIAAAAARAGARAVAISIVASENRTRASSEVAAIQPMLPRDCELWVGGAEAVEVTASVEGFRGLVLESLEAAETELLRIAKTNAGPSLPEIAGGGRNRETTRNGTRSNRR